MPATELLTLLKVQAPTLEVLALLEAASVSRMSSSSCTARLLLTDEHHRLLIRGVILKGHQLRDALPHISTKYLQTLNLVQLKTSDLRISAGQVLWISDATRQTTVASLPTALQEFCLEFDDWANPSDSDDPVCCDEGAKQIARDLPRNLKRLTLHFESGWKFGDDGVQALARALPTTLENLTLEFRGEGERYRNQIGDAGLEVVASALPQQLQVLHLEFHACRITNKALQTLVKALPLQVWLRDLSLSFGNNDIGDDVFTSMPLVLPAHLQNLCLDFHDCDVEDNFGRAIAAAIPDHLVSFDVDLSLTGIGNSGILSITSALPRSLKILELELGSCDIETSFFISFIGSVPSSVKALRLSVWENPQIDGNVAALAIARSLPTGLEELDLHFEATSFGVSGSQAVFRSLPTSLSALRLCFRGCLVTRDDVIEHSKVLQGQGLLLKQPTESVTMSGLYDFCTLKWKRSPTRSPHLFI